MMTMIMVVVLCMMIVRITPERVATNAASVGLRNVSGILHVGRC